MGCDQSDTLVSIHHTEALVYIQQKIIHSPRVSKHQGSATNNAAFPTFKSLKSMENTQRTTDTMLQQIQLSISSDDPMDQLYDQCQKYFQEHKIDISSALAKQLIEHYSKHPELNVQRQQRVQYAKMVLEQLATVNAYAAELDNEGWVFKAEHNNIRVSSRYEDDTVGVLVESDLHVPISTWIAIITEVDLFHKFVPFMELSKQVKTVTRNSKIGHCISNIPFISKRETFFQGVGYDRLEHNKTFLLYTRSLHNDPKLCQELGFQWTPTEGTVQLEYKYFVLQYIPKSERHGSIRMALNVDMKLKYIPMFLLDLSSRQFGFDFISNISKIGKKYQGSEWQKRVLEKPALSKYFQQKMYEYLANRKNC